MLLSFIILVLLLNKQLHMNQRLKKILVQSCLFFVSLSVDVFDT